MTILQVNGVDIVLEHNIAAHTYDVLHPNRLGHEKLGYQFGSFLLSQG